MPKKISAPPHPVPAHPTQKVSKVSQDTGECCVTPQATPKCLGRPRAFDAEDALERAMQVFWRKGYEGASLSDLTEAMGINRPSLYAAFGNKESLFRKVVERYNAGPGACAATALAAPSAREAVEHILAATVEGLMRSDNPAKCLLMESALACDVLPGDLHREVVGHLTAGQCALRVRLERAVSEGELPPSTDCATLARYFTTVMEGLSIQATSGATRAELEAVVATALRAWPETERS